MIKFKATKGKIYLESDCADKQEITVEQSRQIILALLVRIKKETGENTFIFDVRTKEEKESELL